MRRWQIGEDLVLVYRDRSVPASVILAAPSGRSLMLEFDGLLGEHAGAMMVLANEDGEFRTVTTDEPVILSDKPAREA